MEARIIYLQTGGEMVLNAKDKKLTVRRANMARNYNNTRIFEYVEIQSQLMDLNDI